MLQDLIKKGSVDRSVRVSIVDSTDGTPENAVVFNTSGIALWYRREGGAKVALTLATLASLSAAHADGGFLLIGDGAYRLDLPDAAFAAGARYVEFGGTVTGMVVIGGVVKLVDFDFDDPVRGGLTALPNAAAGAVGGLVTGDATNSLKIQDVLKRNVALPGFAFVMTDSTNHNPVTGKTVAVTYSHDGGTTWTSLGNATETQFGRYKVDLTQAAMNAPVVSLRMTASGCDDLNFDIGTVP